MAAYLDTGPWTKLISAFREPLADGGDLAGQRCRGFDPAVDVVLVGIKDVSGRASRYPDKPGCKGPTSGLRARQARPHGKALQSTVVHELAHLAHFAYAATAAAPGWPG